MLNFLKNAFKSKSKLAKERSVWVTRIAQKYGAKKTIESPGLFVDYLMNNENIRLYLRDFRIETKTDCLRNPNILNTGLFFKKLSQCK